MRKTTLVLNSIAVVFFICFLVYTFVARQRLDSLARAFVTEKTLEYSKPIVELAEDALDSRLANNFLADDHIAAIRNEITEYRNDPGGYIADLTRQRQRVAPPAVANPLMERVAFIKNETRTFYDNTLNALITDLRIFAFSNLIAGVIAWGLAFRSSEEIRKPIVWFSLLMFVAVIYCSSLYVDDLTFFRILFRTHMGWWYPVFLCVMMVALYSDFGRHTNAAELSDSHGPAESTDSRGQSTAAGR